MNIGLTSESTAVIQQAYFINNYSMLLLPLQIAALFPLCACSFFKLHNY